MIIKFLLKKYVIFTFLLCGCSSNYVIPIIESTEIFTIDKEVYYVLIYLNGCVACRDVKLKIGKLDDNYKQYFYYLDLEKNKELISPTLESNVNCTTYEDIKIKKTPTLLLIKESIVVEEYVNSINILSYLDCFNI